MLEAPVDVGPGHVQLARRGGDVPLMPVKGLLRATQRAASREPEHAVNYYFPPGHLGLRREIARRYVDLGLSVDPENIVITSGCSEALSLSLQAVTRRGDIVAVESPSYFSVLRLIERTGMLPFVIYRLLLGLVLLLLFY